MNSLLKTSLTVFAMLTLVETMAQQEIEIVELMTQAELEATGVGSLTAAEQAALSVWLEKFQRGDLSPAGVEAQSAATAQTTNPAPSPAASAADDGWRSRPEKVDFVSRIEGEFSGWDGRTQFNLENGQVWVQRRPSRWKIQLQDPEVRIYQNFFGAFEMEIVEEGRSIGVRRVR